MAVGGRGLSLYAKGLIDKLLDVGADVEIGQLVGAGGGVDTVGEEEVDEVVAWVDPGHDAGEACVAEALLAGHRGYVGAASVDEGLVEAQGATVAFVGEMTAVEGVEGSKLFTPTFSKGASGKFNTLVIGD